MPPCRAAGCPQRAVRRGRCATHQVVRSDDRPSAAARGYDRKWRRIRAQYLRKHPRCVVCGADATEVDHVVSLARGGTHQWSNLQAMCKPCHTRKTNAVDGGGW